MVDQSTVRRRRRVVELVDLDVVELIRVEAVQVMRTTQRLDRCEDDSRLGRLLRSRVLAEHCMRADGAVGAHRLVEDLLAVGDEQHAFRLRGYGVEGTEPRLAESR